MSRTFLAAALIFASSIASPASAADAKGVAAELARVIIPKQQWARGIDRLSDGVRGRFEGHSASDLHFPPDFAAKVRADVEAALPYDDYTATYAKALAAGLTEADMKDLLAFYRTPLGQKTVKVMPAISEKFDSDIGDEIKQRMPGVMQKAMKLVKAPADAKAPAHGERAKARGEGAAHPSPVPASK